jgi:hypothetical protein
VFAGEGKRRDGFQRHWIDRIAGALSSGPTRITDSL